MANEIGAAATGGAIGLLGDLVTTGLNRHWANKDWNRNKQYEQELYARNRADYLADLENERMYNSPQAQINRLRAAGLNPNLMNGGSLTTGQSSSAVPMSSPGMPIMSGSVASFGSIASSANAIASGVAASSNADVNQRKADAEIASIKLSNDYKSIEIEFLRKEKELNLEKGRQQLSESIMKCNDYASQISLRNSEIELNGHKIQLIDRQADTEVQNQQLAAARTVLTNLTAEKERRMLPYVQAMKEAEILLTRAKAKAAEQAAIKTSIDASIAMLEEAKLSGLLEAGFVDAEVSRLRAEGDLLSKQGASHDFDVKTRRRAANNAVVVGIGQIVLGAAGLYLGTKIPKVKSFGSSSTWSWKPR